MTRLFLIKEPKNCETINTFLETLEQDKIKYNINYKFEKDILGILVTISWEKDDESNKTNIEISKDKSVSIYDILHKGNITKRSLTPEEVKEVKKYIRAQSATCGCDIL